MINYVIISSLNPGKGTFASPHDSQAGVPSMASLFVVVSFFIFVAYVIYKVRKSLKEDEKNSKIT